MDGIFLALRNEKRELRSFQKIPTIVTLQITFCMLLACHTGSAMRVPVPNTQLNDVSPVSHSKFARGFLPGVVWCCVEMPRVRMHYSTLQR